MGALPREATLQRDGKRWAIATRFPGGMVTPSELERIATVARKHTIPALKITSGQRLLLMGLEQGTLDAVWRDLGMEVGGAPAPCIRSVQACPGTDWCRYGTRDSLSLAKELEGRHMNRTFPAKLKIGVSGCLRSCAGSHLRDIGLLASNRGWSVIFGGNAGRRPRIGDVVGKNLAEDDALDLVNRLMEYYAARARPGERTARFMERIGMETLKSEVLVFAPYIALDEVASG